MKSIPRKNPQQNETTIQGSQHHPSAKMSPLIINFFLNGREKKPEGKKEITKKNAFFEIPGRRVRWWVWDPSRQN